jgi:hypothetical protein
MQQLPTTQLTVQMQGRASNVMILGSEQPGNPKPFANRLLYIKTAVSKVNAC